MESTIDKPTGALASFPVAMFGSTVAIAGLANAFKLGHPLFGIPASWEIITTAICWLIFILLIIAYALKWIHYPAKVTDELTHPVTAHFAGTFFISAVLMAGLTINFSMPSARIVWIAGTSGGLIFIYVLTSRLFKGRLADTDAVPAILIPGLTVLNAATSGASMNFNSYGSQTDSFLFSLGIIYTFTFFILITYRLIHHGPVTNFLKPSLLLMCAPFEVGFQSYVSMVERVDQFASVIFYFGLFIFVVLFFHVFNRSLTFETSWWGACFSTGALANAALRYAHLSQNGIIKIIAAILLVLLTGLILLTTFYTLQWLFKRKLRSDLRQLKIS
jgi:tellurite resistance protein